MPASLRSNTWHVGRSRVTIIPRDTTPMDARNTSLHDYLFDVEYIACWESSTRGFDDLFRQDLMQILKLIAKERLHRLKIA
jgi:hypothetical protein